MKLDSYKITITNASMMPKRKETLQGAMSLVNKLESKGKHGIVEEVSFDEHTLYFKQILRF